MYCKNLSLSFCFLSFWIFRHSSVQIEIEKVDPDQNYIKETEKPNTDTEINIFKKYLLLASK